MSVATRKGLLVALTAGVAFALPCAGPVAEEHATPDDLPRVAEAEADPEAATDEAAVEGPALSARGRYNLGLELLGKGDFEAAAEAFLAARDDAGPDPELRYRAAYNLGMALAARAGLGDSDPDVSSAGEEPPPAQVPEQSPAEVIDILRQSAAWFNDAVRLAPPGDDDARINLEVVSRWILQLADQLNQSDRLEARLDRLIDDQRGLRDQVRQLLTDIAAEDAGTEPVGFAHEFEALASRERVLLAEVGDVIDLAAEERLHIEQAPEEERSPDQQGRAYQLAAMTDYLERARQSLSDARRRLRRLEGERGHRRVDAALAELKRAREQLLDPVTILKAVTRDEQELIVHSRALAAFSDGSLGLDRDPPGWLTAKHLADRQEDIAVRTGGVLSRFEAITASDPSAISAPEAEEAKRAVAAAQEAVPILESGLASMRAAIAALESGAPSAALPEELRAIEFVTEAIELFADVKNLIELAYGTQQGIVALLTPGEASEDETLTETDRETLASKFVADNQRRVGRLETLLEEEAAGARAEAGEDSERLEAVDQRYALAEDLRARAADSLSRLAAGVAEGAVDASRSSASETLEYLEELRRLFFSIVEHVAALLADQADTHDRSATLEAESSAAMGDEYAPAIGAVAERQGGHAGLGDQLAAALAQQADAANASGQPGTGDTPAAGERLAKAAEEVRKASGRMVAAATMLADGAERAKSMSPVLAPALEDQLAAMEHLENALKELVPPERRQQPQNEEQQQGETGAAQPESGEDEQMSQRQALRRLQAIRDREAERQRNRTSQAGDEPVEKDW